MKLITVIGPIGSGKTTVAKLLAGHLKLPLLNADLYEDNPFLPDYIQDTPRWAFATELFFTLKRIERLTPLKTLLKKSSVIVDSGLIMSQIYTKNHLVCGTITPAEWSFYEQIVADYQTTLPSPDIIIYLQAKPATQLSRIRDRGRDFEAGYTLEYLTQITDRLNEYISTIHNQKSKIQVITIDTEKENLLEETAQQILTRKIKNL